MKKKYNSYKKLFITLSVLSAAGFILFKFLPATNSTISQKNEENQSSTPLPTKSPKPSAPTKSPKPSESTTVFSISSIPDNIFQNMKGNSWKDNCTLLKDDLRYLTVSYYGFDEKIHTGELIVNTKIADDVRSIFQELLEARYPIEKIALIDEYQADDEASMAANNTSSFNFRFVDGTTRLSNHAAGFAIDINPLYNPYVRYSDGKEDVLPKNAAIYADRSNDFPYKIDENDLCYKIFTKYGFDWGGSWKSSKDYQHFQKVLSE